MEKEDDKEEAEEEEKRSSKMPYLIILDVSLFDVLIIKQDVQLLQQAHAM